MQYDWSFTMLRTRPFFALIGSIAFRFVTTSITCTNSDECEPHDMHLCEEGICKECGNDTDCSGKFESGRQRCSPSRVCYECESDGFCFRAYPADPRQYCYRVGSPPSGGRCVSKVTLCQRFDDFDCSGDAYKGDPECIFANGTCAVACSDQHSCRSESNDKLACVPIEGGKSACLEDTDWCLHPQRHQSCDWYIDCLEKSHMDCRGGANDYARAHGYETCRRFKLNVTKASPRGQRWMEHIETCLQEALLPLLDSSIGCEQLLDVALASHPHCYSSAGLCSLARKDFMFVVDIISPYMMKRNPQAWTQIVQAMVQCSKRWTTSLKLALDADWEQVKTWVEESGAGFDGLLDPIREAFDGTKDGNNRIVLHSAEPGSVVLHFVVVSADRALGERIIQAIQDGTVVFHSYISGGLHRVLEIELDSAEVAPGSRSMCWRACFS
eukprot:TRINITY_DN21693_c0_g1_i1.p1 TRINITY_DN21693_c0_g1~~TRINITY_DN21693_c0_g1_i1.p1  ORF type:complete len:441 (+),score=36.80 TRINITY_DN21693_c0_g1_i1:54-1376(+)